LSDLIANERTKLLANALDRASTACLTVGVFTPAAAVVYHLTGNLGGTLTFFVGTFVWLFSAVLLHIEAWRTLGALR
jgi:hypothetical protein